MKVDIAIPDLPKFVGERGESRVSRLPCTAGSTKGLSRSRHRPRRRSRSTARRSAQGHRCKAWMETRVAIRPMSGTPQIWFGRRQASRLGTTTVKEAESPLRIPRLPPGAAIVELRSLCLAEMDPTSLAKLTPEELTQEVERTLAEIATQRRIQLNGREQRALARELVNDMLGLGPLEPLLEDDAITDIMVNGPEKVFVERHGKLELSGVRFRDAGHVAHVCQRIAVRVGRRIDESSPMVDARLKDGSRVNIVFPPLALDGPYISIRKFSRTQDRLCQAGGIRLADAAGGAAAGNGRRARVST